MTVGMCGKQPFRRPLNPQHAGQLAPHAFEMQWEATPRETPNPGHLLAISLYSELLGH